MAVKSASKLAINRMLMRSECVAEILQISRSLSLSLQWAVFIAISVMYCRVATLRCASLAAMLHATCSSYAACKLIN